MIILKTCALLCAAAVIGASCARCGEEQTIARADEHQKFTGPAEIFTGDVEVTLLFGELDGISASAGMVTFQPGARSFWHVHPAGQQLVILSGEGRTGTWGGVVETVRAGDVITCPKGVKHWHGASPTSAMTHLTVTGELDGKNVEWLEAVTDDQYTISQ